MGQVSDAGVEFLERHEGVVLKAYRDPVGIWTIGAGLTRASGVVVPKAGMRITKVEASRLLHLAINRNYDPTVSRAMPDALQREHDAGLSFHYNIGAIGSATWIKKWRVKDWPGVEEWLAKWNKAGGRVLPGLVRRRTEEYELLRIGRYSGAISMQVPGVGAMAKIVVPLDRDDVTQLRIDLRTLGYNLQGGLTDHVIREFQKAHDLTVDGLIGRATLSTIQRRIDARQASNNVTLTGGVTAGSGGLEAWNGFEIAPPVIFALIGVAIAFYALWQAWRYRDALAVKIQKPFPKLAALLRSV
jgi:lysozyme